MIEPLTVRNETLPVVSQSLSRGDEVDRHQADDLVEVDAGRQGVVGCGIVRREHARDSDAGEAGVDLEEVRRRADATVRGGRPRSS